MIGTEWLSLEPDSARARIQVEEHHHQPMGIVHGGVLASLIESTCSHATGLAVLRQGRIAVGQSLAVNLLRPIEGGVVEVEAVAIHRGRTSWVWTARVTDAEHRLCAQGQMTMAVREPPEGIHLPKV